MKTCTACQEVRRAGERPTGCAVCRAMAAARVDALVPAADLTGPAVRRALLENA